MARAEQERLRPAPTHDCDTRPWPNYEDQDALFDEFTRRFDPTPHLIELHRLHGEATWRHPDEDAAFISSMVLAKEGNSLPLTEAYPDWRPALIDLANGICCERLAAAMPAAFARYSLCLESGLRPPPPREKPAFDEENPVSLLHHREQVLRGRELNGEARDFEF